MYPGIVTTLLGIVQNYSGLLAARFFLGEYPGLLYLTGITLTMYAGLAEAGLC